MSRVSCLLRRLPLLAITTFATFPMSPPCASATDWFVDPNGPLTIQDAIDGASAGDAVVLRAGIHQADSTVVLKHGVSLVSEDGTPETTWVVPAVIVDFQPILQIPTDIDGTTRIAGITFRDGRDGLYVRGSPVIEDCVVGPNTGSWYVMGAAVTGSPTIRRCVFDSNRAWDVSAQGGGLVTSVTVTLEDCVISNNRPRGLQIDDGDVHLIRCRVEFNRPREGVGVWKYRGSLTATDCSFIDNGTASISAVGVDLERCVLIGSFYGLTGVSGSVRSSTIVGCTRGVRAIDETTIESSIIAFNGASATGPVTLSCSDVFGNTNGDWVGDIAGQDAEFGNFSADPLFCDLEAGDLTLNSRSPCLPQNLCGLVGALGLGCGTVSVRPESWGRIKGRFDSTFR